MKFSIRFASNQVLYWHGILCGNKTLDSELDTPTVEKLLNGQYKNAHLKRLKGHNIYTARINASDRLLFTSIERNGQWYLVILDRIYNHDYQKSAFLQAEVLQNYIDQNEPIIQKNIDRHCTQDDFESMEDSDEDSKSDESTSSNSESKIQYQAVKQYKKTFIQLTGTQEQVIQSPLPMFVSGVAGSGKTCVAMRKLIDYVNLHQEDGHRIIYITQSAHLAVEMAQLWRASSEVKPHKNTVEFLCYADLARKQDETLQSSQFVGLAQFKQWLPKKEWSHSVEALYEELRLITTCASVQIYIASGSRNSLLTDNDVKWHAYQLAQRYFSYCEKEKCVDLAIRPIKITKQYALVIVDEAQDFSRVQLKTLTELAEHQQHCFCFDVNQSINEIISIGPYLQQLLTADSQSRPTHFHLLESHRTPIAVNMLATAVSKIKNYLLKGAYSYSYVELFAHSNANQGLVHWHHLPLSAKNIPARLLDLIQSPDCAIIVSTEDQKALVRKLLYTPLLFTISEIKGLEFRYVILFNLANGPLFREISAQLPDSLNDYVPSINRPKNRDEKSNDHLMPSLCQLFTGITRAQEELWILEELRSDLRKLHHLMKSSQTDQKKSIEQTPVTKGTEATWMARAEQLDQHHHAQQAEAIRNKFPGTSKKAKSTSAVSSTAKEKKIVPITAAPAPSPAEVYVFKLNSSFSEENLTKLLLHNNFHNLFFLTRFGSGFTLFESTAAKLDQQEYDFFIQKIKDSHPHFLRILTECTIHYLFNFVTVKDTQKLLPSAFDAYSHTENGRKFLTCLFDHNQKLAMNVTSEQIYNFKFTLKKGSNRFTQLCSTETGREVLYAILQQSNRLIKEDPRYYDIFLQEFHGLSKDISGRAIILRYLQFSPKLLKRISHRLLFNEIFGPSAFYNLVRSKNGINILGMLFTDSPQLVQHLPANFFQHSQEGEEIIPSLFAILGCSTEGCTFLNTIFKIDVNLFKKINIREFFKLDFLSDDDSDRHSMFDYLVTYDRGYKLLEPLLNMHPNYIEYIQADDLFFGDYTNMNNIPSWFKMASNKQGIELLSAIFASKPDLIQSISQTALFKYLSAAEAVHLKSTIKNAEDCECDVCSNSYQLKMNQIDALENFSTFHLLARSRPGLTILLEILKKDDKFIHWITTDFLCLPRSRVCKDPTLLALLCMTTTGREVLKLILKVNLALDHDRIREELFTEYEMRFQDKVETSSAIFFLANSNDVELKEIFNRKANEVTFH